LGLKVSSNERRTLTSISKGFDNRGLEDRIEF
jgi:hypothetical protein